MASPADRDFSHISFPFGGMGCLSSPSPDLPGFHFAQPPWQRADSVDSGYSGGGDNESSLDHLHSSEDYDGVDIDDTVDPYPALASGSPPYHSSSFPKQSPQVSLVRRGSQDSVTGALRVSRPPPATPRIVHHSLPPPVGYTPMDTSSAKHGLDSMCVDLFERKKRRMGSSLDVGRFRTDFTQVELIGKGSFADVFRVNHRVDGQWYAIKRIKKQCTGESDRVAIEREARALALVASCSDQNSLLAKHIVKYYSSWFEDGRLFIQTEYCTSTLFSALSTPLNRKTILYILRDIAAALVFLHDHLALVHLDVKPANILIASTTSGEPMFKLGDLGLVCTSVAGELTELTSGDARYLPREILANNFSNLPKADVFSLGATVLECLLGSRLPAEGDEWHHIRDGRLGVEHQGDQLVELVSQMLGQDAAKRPDCAAVMAAAELMIEQIELTPPKSIILTLKQTRQKLRKMFTAN